ncbi:DUF4159 domain-containing protein [Planctomycetota bacterium]|nr:DUF4159 domain-containing protein [Planctomycetota bacterium]
MKNLILTTFIAAACIAIAAALPASGANNTKSSREEEGVVHTANLVYGSGKTSVCFSDQFLTQIEKDTHIRTYKKFHAVKLESEKLYEYPFAVMTGEGTFRLTKTQRINMRDYLNNGGFIIASAGCSSKKWNNSFKQEITRMFPKKKLKELDKSHRIFHTVYDITSSKYKSGNKKLPELHGLEVDGKVVLIWSPDGLNDTANAGANCCCCGGNEIKSARILNVNILAYALTH